MVISSSRLKVTIESPGEFPNNTCRFDRAGFITSVLLDGKYEFCSAEPENLSHKSSGGRGLCNEFIDQAVSENTPANEFFPKPGIGLLRKKGDLPYCFFDTYETLPFPIEWNASGDTVTFRVLPIPCQGFEFTEIRQISVDGSRLTNRVTFTNTGEKPLNYTEYCHNFMTCMRLPLGNAYHLRMPGILPRPSEILSGILKGEGAGFTFDHYSPKSMLYTIPKSELVCDGTFTWQMYHDQLPFCISVTEGFKPCHVSIWAVDHLISVEVFCPIKLLPGESKTWDRSWEFNLNS